MIRSRDIPLTLDWVRGVKTMEQLAEEHSISRARVGQITIAVLSWAGVSSQQPAELISLAIVRKARHGLQRDTPEAFYYLEQVYRSDPTQVARAHGATIYAEGYYAYY